MAVGERKRYLNYLNLYGLHFNIQKKEFNTKREIIVSFQKFDGYTLFSIYTENENRFSLSKKSFFLKYKRLRNKSSPVLTTKRMMDQELPSIVYM